jgi:hypothetical protein
MKKLFFVINLFAISIQASSDRIQSLRFDKSQVQRIYLAPGLGSILIFPCGLQEVFVGRSDDLKAQVSPNDKKTLFLNLKLSTYQPTNLIAKCELERSIFIFDIIPSTTKHQDLVEIRSSFGSPRLQNAKLIQSSSVQATRDRYFVRSYEIVGRGVKK